MRVLLMRVLLSGKVRTLAGSGKGVSSSVLPLVLPSCLTASKGRRRWTTPLSPSSCTCTAAMAETAQDRPNLNAAVDFRRLAERNLIMVLVAALNCCLLNAAKIRYPRISPLAGGHTRTN